MAKDPSPNHNIAGINKATLKGFVDELDAAMTERATINEQMAEIRAAAKAGGYDPKTIMRIVRNKRRSKADIQVERENERIYEDLLDNPFDDE